MISGALYLLSSFMQISPTSSRTFESTEEMSASRVCSWSHPALLSSFPFLARLIRLRHSAYAFSTRASFPDASMGPGMTSLIPSENP